MAQRASVGLTSRLLGMTLTRILMLFQTVLMKRFLASLTSLEVILLCTLLNQVRIKSRNLKNLPATQTVAKHETWCKVVQIKFVALCELFTLDPTELAFMWKLRILCLVTLFEHDFLGRTPCSFDRRLIFAAGFLQLWPQWLLRFRGCLFNNRLRSRGQ